MGKRRKMVSPKLDCTMRIIKSSPKIKRNYAFEVVD